MVTVIVFYRICRSVKRMYYHSTSTFFLFFFTIQKKRLLFEISNFTNSRVTNIIFEDMSSLSPSAWLKHNFHIEKYIVLSSSIEEIIKSAHIHIHYNKNSYNKKKRGMIYIWKEWSHSTIYKNYLNFAKSTSKRLREEN